MKKPVVLMILDGFGHRKEDFGNAVNQAKKPNYDNLISKYPSTYLKADGLGVGLPDGQMGNSEVGHLNLGAGRVVYQSLVLINKAIEEKKIYENDVIVSAMDNACDNSLHLWGLLSDGGVHSHINHLFGLMDMAKEKGIKNLYIHPVLDGRDVDPKSAKVYLQQLIDKIEDIGLGEIASISGRYYAMDRDKRWERVLPAYQAMVEGSAEYKFDNPLDYIDQSYVRGELDEFILPAVNKNLSVKVNDNDSIIFTNFRPDRASQLAGVITNPDYNPKPEEPIFSPEYRPSNLKFVQLMKYSDDVVGDIAFVPQKLVNTFGDVIEQNNMKQLRIAETEKYPHVTFFFDGGVDKEIKGSKRVLINSPKVATYDLQPEMSAAEVTDSLLKELDTKEYDTVILNFANPDMVGHSGNLQATIKAIETVDLCIKRVYDKVVELDGVLLITADHGNADKVLNADGSPNTAHTNSEVPLVITKKGLQLNQGTLSDVIPTMLDLLNIKQPKEMTGESLINE